jgi:dTDP-glucose 4,6-dehydratase
MRIAMRVLITGAAGFIGSHIVEGALKKTDWHIVALDRLDETSTLDRIGYTDAYKLNRSRFTYVWHDLRAPINDYVANVINGHGDGVDVILHLAASTHVDRSIADPSAFVADNVVGTMHALDFARRMTHRESAWKPRFVYFSTDEVFGPAAPGQAFGEWDRYKASNPYAASKAAGEELTLSYVNTYGLQAFVTHTINAFGERQHYEKFLPMLVRKILLEDKVLIHADPGKTIPASRFWIHARNIFAALRFLLEHGGQPGEKYNIGSKDEVDCLSMAKRIAGILGRELDYELVDSVTNRPGHDMRYALDCTRLYDEMGFVAPVPFSSSLERCVRWMAANPRWLGL